MKTYHTLRPFLAIALLLLIFTFAGCYNPLAGYNAQHIRQCIIADAQRDANTDKPQQQLYSDTQSQTDQSSRLSPQRIAQIDEQCGPQSYVNIPINPGLDLTQTSPTFTKLSLQGAVESAVVNNLDVQIARLVPQMSFLSIIEAQADFTPEIFSSLGYKTSHRPKQSESSFGYALPIEEEKINTTDAVIGIRSNLKTGAEVTFSSSIAHVDDRKSIYILNPEPGVSSNIHIDVRQPLLRNFGQRVNTMRIKLARSTNAADAFELNRQLSETILSVEAAYWELSFARDLVAIRKRISDITIKTRNELIGRRNVDVSPLQLAQVDSYVQSRQADLISAQRAFGEACDKTRQIINSPKLPISGDQMIEPVDLPTEELLDVDFQLAVELALKNRPEMGQALLLIEDSELRQFFADNQQKAKLDIIAEANYFGLTDRIGSSFEHTADGDFGEYSLGIEYSDAINHKGSDAVAGRMRLTRIAQVISYNRTAQGVIISTKSALRALRNTHQLIINRRNARRAAAENLRVLIDREETSTELTPEFLLNLKLTTQQGLAEAQIQEARAIVNYNIANAQFLASIGSLLEIHGISKATPILQTDIPHIP